jgi:hypothetical protein
VTPEVRAVGWPGLQQDHTWLEVDPCGQGHVTIPRNLPAPEVPKPLAPPLPCCLGSGTIGRKLDIWSHLLPSVPSSAPSPGYALRTPDLFLGDCSVLLRSVTTNTQLIQRTSACKCLGQSPKCEDCRPCEGCLGWLGDPYFGQDFNTSKCEQQEGDHE